MKKNKKNQIQTTDQPFFNFKAEAQDRWNRRKAGKKSFVWW